MTPLNSFLRLVNMGTYGAPRMVQAECLLNACIEFCEKSHCWIQSQADRPYQLNVGQGLYDYNLDPGQAVVDIRGAHLLGNNAPKVWPRDHQWLDLNYPGWEDGAQIGKPTNVTHYDPSQFMPVPWTDGSGWQMVLRLSLKPIRQATLVGLTTTLVPDILFNDYYDAIVAGTKARLFSIEKQKWTNPELALANGGFFDGEATKAKNRADAAFGRARHRVQGQYV